MRNGTTVAAFEREFAAYVGAKYAIACANGTVTLQGALAALGVQNGDRVAVPPLTMAATTMAALNVGAVPVFVDVSAQTWLMAGRAGDVMASIPVSLYGLRHPMLISGDLYANGHNGVIDDAAQTLRQHSDAAFTSYSFQASKILSTGEGGMLVTNDEDLAAGARSYLSLGYRMRADQARIDPAEIKHPTYIRHHLTSAINGRMNDATAALGLTQLERANELLANRREAALHYWAAVQDCRWLTTQHIPVGWTHDYWCFTVALKSPDLFAPFTDAIVRHGGERPYGAWRLTYREPAFRRLADHQLSAGPDTSDGASICPVAESLQPRLVQFQTNRIADAERNARAVRLAITELGG